MKIKYKRSIQEYIDEYIDIAIENNAEIEYIQLTESEYIQFLEEIDTIQKVLLDVPPKRVYRLVQLKIVPE